MAHAMPSYINVSFVVAYSMSFRQSEGLRRWDKQLRVTPRFLIRFHAFLWQEVLNAKMVCQSLL